MLSMLNSELRNGEESSIATKSQIDENVNPGSKKAPKLSANKVFEFFDEFADYQQEHVPKDHSDMRSGTSSRWNTLAPGGCQVDKPSNVLLLSWMVPFRIKQHLFLAFST